MFYRKNSQFRTLWENNSPLDNRYFNFISGQFLLGRRGRKTQNKKMLAYVRVILITIQVHIRISNVYLILCAFY